MSEEFEIRVGPLLSVQFGGGSAMVAALGVWTLARGVFPYYHRGLSAPVYWCMAAVSVAGLIGSLLVHEVGHALATPGGFPRPRRVRMFVYGGVADLHARTSWLHEARIALAGPTMTIVAASVLHATAAVATGIGVPVPVIGVLQFLSSVNVIICFLNLVPVLPLDGGWMLRAFIRAWGSDDGRAAWVSSLAGTAFGILLVLGGILLVLRGTFVGGIWWVLVGSSLQGGSHLALHRYELGTSLRRRSLEGFPLAKAVELDPAAYLSDVRGAIELGDRCAIYPVVQDHRFVGYLTSQNLMSPDQSTSSRVRVGGIMRTDRDVIITEETDLHAALSRMYHLPARRLVVVNRSDEVRGVLCPAGMLPILKSTDLVP